MGVLREGCFLSGHGNWELSQYPLYNIVDPLTCFQALVFSHLRTLKGIKGGLSSGRGRSSSL